MSDGPIRVLHVVGFMGRGGAETWLMHLLRRLDATQFHFDFCTCWPRPGDFDTEVGRLGGKILPCALKRHTLTFPRRFRHILREGRYDVVHSHVEWASGLILRQAGLERVPLRIAHMHTTDDRKFDLRRKAVHSVMRYWLREYATHGLAVSPEAAAVLFGPKWRSDRRNHVLPYGIDLDQFRQPVSREAVRKELGIPIGAPVVGHVGRFVAAKNHPFVLALAAEVIKVRPEVRFLLVGDGPLRPEVEAGVRDLGLGPNVVLTGERGDVPRLMLGAMDVLVLPSLFEGLPIVILEAQAAGLRCLASEASSRAVAVIPTAVEFLPLSLGTNEWASRLVQALDRGRLPQRVALDCLEQGGFGIERSYRFLVDLYRGKCG